MTKKERMARNKDLATRAKDGDMEARDKLIEENMGLVRYFADRHRTATYEFDDAVQDGVLGLLEAADVFDPERGNYTAIAGSRICLRMREGIGRSLPTTIPECAVNNSNKRKKMLPSTVAAIDASKSGGVRLDALESPEALLGRLDPDIEDALDRKQMLEAIKRVAATMPYSLREVIEMSAAGMTREDIGGVVWNYRTKGYGISTQAVSQRMIDALEWIRVRLRREIRARKGEL